MDRLGETSIGSQGSNSGTVVVMGASNLAARRAAKANRRKAIVAQKRKAEAAMGTVAGQVLRSVGLPIRCCLLSEALFECGMGTMILARGSSVGPVIVGGFLLDTFCRGVKDVLFHIMDQSKLEIFLEAMNDTSSLVPVDPSYARKLVRDAVRWSATLGFQPHRDFAALERLFGDVDPQACDVSFEFGMGGKPLYISGPMESSSAAREDVSRLYKQLGSDAFDYVVPV